MLFLLRQKTLSPYSSLACLTKLASLPSSRDLNGLLFFFCCCIFLLFYFNYFVIFQDASRRMRLRFVMCSFLLLLFFFRIGCLDDNKRMRVERFLFELVVVLRLISRLFENIDHALCCCSLYYSNRLLITAATILSMYLVFKRERGRKKIYQAH